MMLVRRDDAAQAQPAHKQNWGELKAGDAASCGVEDANDAQHAGGQQR
jgi:hypothetical protein